MKYKVRSFSTLDGKTYNLERGWQKPIILNEHPTVWLRCDEDFIDLAPGSKTQTSVRKDHVCSVEFSKLDEETVVNAEIPSSAFLMEQAAVGGGF